MERTVVKTRKPAAPVKKAKPAIATKNKSVPAVANKMPRKTPKNSEKKEITETAKSTFDIDFCGVKLNIKRRAFLRYYLTPGSPSFNNALQSAIKAGYSEGSAKTEIYKILCEPDIVEIVRANEGLEIKALGEAAKRAIEIKKQRAFFDPIDYFEKKTETRYAKDGSKYDVSVLALKDMEKMTPEQRMSIDGLDVKGNTSVPVYLMANRDKNLDDILKISKEKSGSNADGDGEEETMEIIMERLTVRKTVRAGKDEVSKIAGLMRLPKGEEITEL